MLLRHVVSRGTGDGLPKMARDRGKSGIKKLADKQILVVEDHPFLGEILTALLTLFDHPSHAESGKEALKQIQQKRPNIILLDLGLPDMTGLEFVKLVRQNETTKSIRILAMSGSPMDKPNCLQAGCDDFILKPFSTSTLLAQLSKLAARRVRIDCG
jgi:two-component system, OmpR family, KDP operon response regulator KdpE